MVSPRLQAAKEVFEQCDLDNADHSDIKQCLAWMNYQASNSDVQNACKNRLMAQKPGHALGDRALSEPGNPPVCMGDAQGNLVVYWVYVVRYKSLPTLGTSEWSEDTVRALVKKTKRPLLCLTDGRDMGGNDRYGSDKAVEAHAFMERGELGQVVGSKDRVLVVQWRCPMAYVPTWLDMNLTWYWMASTLVQPGLEFGLTRCLKTGQPGLREWVVPKDNEQLQFQSAKLWEIPALYLAEDRLGEEYWQGCRGHILEQRKQWKTP